MLDKKKKKKKEEGGREGKGKEGRKKRQLLFLETTPTLSIGKKKDIKPNSKTM